MPRIVEQFDQALSNREIQLFLDALPGNPHCGRNLRGGLRFSCDRDCAEDLPAGTRQGKRPNQSVPFFQ